MKESLRRFVRNRAAGLCEYCHFPEAFSFLPFQIDHIIAEKHHGKDSRSNVAGIDPDASMPVRLFHPRNDSWADHFQWRGPLLVPKSLVGRITIDVLRMNHADVLSVRRELLRSGERLG